MIYTITLNPALDYVVKMQNFQTGKINYSNEEYLLPGGKGINVSIILKTLGIDSTALGFIAGVVGDEIEKKVKEHEVGTDFIKIENDMSRINVKVATLTEETAINGKGPLIEEVHIKLLYQKIGKIKHGDILILSGSIPRGITTNIYCDICKQVKEKGVKIIVDSTGELLVKTLEYSPFLIKPNHEELGEIFNTKIIDRNEAIEYAKKLQQKGAKNILVSMGKMGAVLLDEEGNSYKMKAINTEKRINTVGAGDSMVAGFIAGYQMFHDYEKALQMGIVAATATTNSMALATKDEIYKLLDSLQK